MTLGVAPRAGRTAFVTGGSGFIGGHVVRALLDAGYAVRALQLPGERPGGLADLPVERVLGDVRDARAVRAAMAGCDRVFHLAALYALWTPRPALLHEVNVDGTRAVLEAAWALGVERVVHTSSIAVFGGQGPGRDATERSPFRLGPTGDAYARSKYDAHRVAEGFARRGLELTIVAPTGPLGPGDRGPTPTGRILLSALQLPAPLLVRSEACVGDVRDMAAGHLLAADRGARGESYLLGQENLRFAEIVRRLLAVAGQRKPVVELPTRLLDVPARAALAAARLTRRAPLITPAVLKIARLGLRADCSRARRELGLPTRPLDETLRDALAWFRAAGWVSAAG